MARAPDRTIVGEAKTTLGSRRTQGIVAIETGAGFPIDGSANPGLVNKPALLVMDSVSSTRVVTSYYIWVNQHGILRISAAKPTTELSDGAAVGDQTGT